MGGGKGARAVHWLGTWVLAVALGCAAGAPALLSPEALEPLQGRAERARGLLFGEPIRARLVSRGNVEALLAETIGRVYTPGLRRTDEIVKKTVGLLPADADLWKALLEFQSEAVVGFYAPLDRQLYVIAEPGEERGESLLGAGVDQVLVHELVHALQDIHTDLIDVSLGLLDHDDLAFAIGALLEGDATWAGHRDEALGYGLPMPPPEQVASEFEVELFGKEHPEIPRLVREGLVLQYPAGYDLVTRILEAGGAPALDAALLDPPLTSEEVLHPERYLDSSRRGPLLFLELESGGIAPSAECTTVGANTFGEFGLRIWAQERGMGGSEAAAAAEGWDADRAVVFECLTGRAFAWLIEFETMAKARDFAETARRMARPSTGVDDLGTRVLLWSNLDQSGRDVALLETKSQIYRDLSEYLDARPAILERTRLLRGRGSAGGAEGGGHQPAESRGGEGERDL
jgi:hypothetical protein